MRFFIKRVSDYQGNDRPCAKAEKTDDPMTFRRWAIEVNSLEELMALSLEVGDDLVFSPKYPGPTGGPTLTIYDDYLE